MRKQKSSVIAYYEALKAHMNARYVVGLLGESTGNEAEKCCCEWKEGRVRYKYNPFAP